MFDECTLLYKKHHLIQRDKTKDKENALNSDNGDLYFTRFMNFEECFIFTSRVPLFTPCQILVYFNLPSTKKPKKMMRRNDNWF